MCILNQKNLIKSTSDSNNDRTEVIKNGVYD